MDGGSLGEASMRTPDEYTEDWEHRFWAKVSPEPMSGCWLWTASLDGYGYGQFGKSKGVVLKAYRLSYELLVGPVPDGLEIDHLCRVRACLNPDHLEAVTHRENMRRAALLRTHCPSGHQYSGDNLYVNRGSRFCRRCHVLSERARRATLRFRRNSHRFITGKAS